MSGLAVDRQGHGPAVVLLHGVGGGKALWNAEHAGTTAALAAAGFQAIALDLPGYGASTGGPATSIAGMADAVLNTLDDMDVEAAAFVGHSMGGMVAQDLAARAPGRVTALVLACTSSAFGPPGGTWQEAFVRDRIGTLEACGSMEGMARALVPPMLGPKARPGVGDQAVQVMKAVPESTYRLAIQALAGFDRRASLAEMNIPALCIAGEVDRTSPPDVLRRMAQRLPQGEFLQIEGAGHLAPLESPHAFHDAVTGFLRRHLT